ncbi:MAG TPA: right-handed parallel beta-helix repeat-containing protein [Thermomicrobiaceae bacterium]|nr:right-handed parallel beta-helix repeat-containing protein [Thermomicrobiaceae bacterium]
MHRRIVMLVGLLVAIGPLAAVFPALAGPALAGGGCLTAGTSGLTAVVVATTGQVITGTLDASASGCDLGIYVGPGVTHVTIAGATISGAADEGILVQDTSLVTIRDTTVTGNGGTHEAFPETKGIQLVGSSLVIVAGNTVSGNAGGIGIADDGSFDPSAPNPGLTRPGSNNQVVNNRVTDSTAGCGIVVAAYNPGAGVANNVVLGNTVSGNPAGIVVAADMPDSTATTTLVLGNTSTGNGYAGIIVHSNAPGDGVTHTHVVGNTVSGNQPYGILVAAGEGATLGWTDVVANQIAHEFMGIGHFGDTHTAIAANTMSSVTIPVGVGH